MADIDQIRVELDDIRHRAARRFHLRLDRGEHSARLALDVAEMAGLSFVVVVHLARDEDNALRAGDFDRLGIARWVEYGFGGNALDLDGHDHSPCEGATVPPLLKAAACAPPR